MMEMLYKKKVIRDFLSLFTENYWKQLICHVVEYGIILFKKHHNIAALTPEDIFLVVENLKKEEMIFDKKKENRIKDEKVNRSMSKDGRLDIGRIRNNDSKKKMLRNVPSAKSINSENSFSHSKERTKKQLTPGRDKTGIFKFNSHKDKDAKNEEFGRSKNLTDVKTSRSRSKNSSVNKKSFLNALKKDITHSNTETPTNKSNLKQTKDKKEKKEKKVPLEILEQKNINKILNKRKKISSNEQKEKDSDKESLREQPVIAEKKDREKEKEKDIRDDMTELQKTTKYINKYSNVESRIKSVIDKDRQQFNNNSQKGVVVDKEKYNDNENENENENDNYNDNITPLKMEDDDNHSNYFKKVLPQNFDNSSSNIVSLEDKLNGLTQKLSKIERMSTGDITNTKPTIGNSGMNLKISPLGTTNKDTKGYVYEKQNTNSSNHDEDYLAEDQIDFNKYNLYSRHFNEEGDQEEIDNDEEN